MKTASDTAILILSCDKYRDAWKPFFELFRKFWTDCEFPVYLGNNELDFEFPKVTVIHSGKPLDWSSDTKNILKQIPEKFVIVLLEDYFLERPVDTNWLNECVTFTKEKEASFMRIASFREDHFPMYAFDVMEDNPRFGLNRKEPPFRINLQAGIWKKDDLENLIVLGESPWEFEVKGSIRSQSSNKPFLGITETSKADILVGPIPYLCTAITKGTWMREAVSLCKKENISLDLKYRPVESFAAYAKRKFYHSFSYPNRKYIDYLSLKIRKEKK